MWRNCLFVGLLAAGIIGCRRESATRPVMTIATTTSVRDTGLLDILTSMFQQEQQVDAKVVAVGSGQAIELARRGDADVLITHAPEMERKFVADGFGVERRPFMRNEFIIVGPVDDPAGIEGQHDGAAALGTIAQREATFVSRGDESGTHVKERSLWERTGAQHDGPWYVEAGTGMAATLRMAHEKGAYTLTDRGTYLSLRSELDLPIMVEGDPALENIYSVTVVSSEKHPHVNSAAAEAFADFLFSPRGQRTIAKFGVDRFGEAMFHLLKDK